jgi:hypothetical protein
MATMARNVAAFAELVFSMEAIASIVASTSSGTIVLACADGQ